MIKSHFSRLFLCLIFALALFGCVGAGADQHITLYGGEAWELETIIAFNGEQMQLFDVSPEQMKQEVEQGLPEQEAEWDAAGIKHSFETEVDQATGAFVITMDLSGDGFDKLEEYVMADANIRYIEEGSNEIAVSVSNTPLFSDFQFYSLRLSAGNIVETNGFETGRGEVEWSNLSGTARATVTSKTTFAGWLGPILAVLAVAVVGYFSWNIVAKKERQVVAGNVPVCGTCGQPHAAGAAFCAKCGSKIQSEK